MEKDYLIRRRPIAALLIFALPMMLGNFFQQLYTMADSAIVGRLVGEEALAAVGASYSLTNVFISSPSAEEWALRSSQARPLAAGIFPG